MIEDKGRNSFVKKLSASMTKPRLDRAKGLKRGDVVLTPVHGDSSPNTGDRLSSSPAATSVHDKGRRPTKEDWKKQTSFGVRGNDSAKEMEELCKFLGVQLNDGLGIPADLWEAHKSLSQPVSPIYAYATGSSAYSSSEGDDFRFDLQPTSLDLSSNFGSPVLSPAMSPGRLFNDGGKEHDKQMSPELFSPSSGSSFRQLKEAFHATLHCQASYSRSGSGESLSSAAWIPEGVLGHRHSEPVMKLELLAPDSSGVKFLEGASESGKDAKAEVKAQVPAEDGGGTRSCPTPPKNSNKRVIHRCQTSPAVTNATRGKRGGGEALERPEFEKGSSIVLQAGIGVMVYLAAGVLIYTWKNKEFSGLETNSFVDGLYFCVVTMCTIGYGDIVPVTPFTKFFACGFVLVGFGFIDALVSGMVTYMLDKQEHLLLSAVEGSHHQAAKKYVLNPKHGNRMRIRVKVGLALGIPILCIVVGTLVMMHLEKLHWIDALYCTIMSVTTVGYGDHTFKSFQGRLFAALWLLFSTLAVARCFLYLAEVRVDKRHRAIAKWVLRRGLTFADLVQADLDHNGCISKAEFVIYKLREMGKLDDKDIADVIQEFTELDIHNTGKITRAYLQEGD
ncbi:unnamed protein product [Sphagnum jensenii]